MIPPLLRKSYSFQKSVHATIRRHDLLEPDDRVIVAVSGGSDSMALLLALARLNLTEDLIGVYIDHGLRPEESPAEIALVKDFCESLNVKFHTKAIDVIALAHKEHLSVEDAARRLRYGALEDIRVELNATKIAVGHHSDDQVEEFFLRLIRGSGSTGLSGMRPRYKNIVRPLLFESKESITTYLEEQKISWLTDSSNLENEYLRNRIRLDLLPLLERSFNPNLRNSVLNSMDVLFQENKLLTEITEKSFPKTINNGEKGNQKRGSIQLVLAPFLAEHSAIRRRILEKLFWIMDSSPSYTNIIAIEELSLNGENGEELHLKNGLRAIKTKDKIVFYKPELQNNRGSEKQIPPYKITVDGPGNYPIPESGYCIVLEKISNTSDVVAGAPSKTTLYLDVDNVTYPLTIRPYRPGEKFRPNENSGSKKISRYFNEVGLDKRKRASWPLLFQGNQAVAIASYCVDYTFSVGENCKGVLAVKLLNDTEI